MEKMNKKAMLARNWIVIAVMISFIFISAGTWINQWDGIYYENDTTENFTSYNYLDRIAIETDSLESSLQSENKASNIGFLDFVINGGYNILITIMGIPTMLLGLVYYAGAEMGIPDSYVTGFIILMTSALVFGIVSAIFRRKS